MKHRIVLFCVTTPCRLVGSGEAYRLHHTFHPEDGGSMLLRNIGTAYKTTRHHNPKCNNPLRITVYKMLVLMNLF
jgi:hypothetical protein